MTAVDARGNVTSKLTTTRNQTLVFDAANRLSQVTGRQTYRYDGLGRRVQTTDSDGKQTYRLYTQAGQVLYSYEARRSQTIAYISLGNSQIATRTVASGSGTVTVHYEHTDALGSPVAETDAPGSPGTALTITRHSYMPYGNVFSGGSVDGTGYTGHVMDADTGLTYMQQRYYDPQVGRFISTDPADLNLESGANFNRYWYANNNPFRFTDPDGRMPGNICDSGPTGCEVVSPYEAGAAEQRSVVDALRRNGIQVFEGVKLSFEDSSGKTVNAVADYVARAGDKLLVGEIKAGLHSKFSGAQKIVYSALKTGSVRVLNSKVALRLGLKQTMLLNGETTNLAVHATEGGRASRQAARLFPGAAKLGGELLEMGAKVAKAADAPLLFLTVAEFDEYSSLIDTCPLCATANAVEITQ